MTKEALTEDEQAAAGVAMLSAALEAFGVMPADKDQDQDEMARLVVAALAAAQMARKSQYKILKDLGRDGPCMYIEIDAHEAVATAFWMWSERIEMDVSEVSASSVIGTRYLALAQGLAAARAISVAVDIMSDGSGFVFDSDAAEHLLHITK